MLRISLLALVVSSSAQAYSFISWHPSGAFYYQQVKAPAVQACREDVNDIPPGWPEGVTSMGPGVSCADLPETIGGKPALDFAKKDTKGVHVDKKSVYGLDLTAAVQRATSPD